MLALLVYALSGDGESWAQTQVARVEVLAVPFRGAADSAAAPYYEAFRKTLAQYGWTDCKNVSFEYRSGLGNPPQSETAAAELVTLNVDVILANSAQATRAA